MRPGLSSQCLTELRGGGEVNERGPPPPLPSVPNHDITGKLEFLLQNTFFLKSEKSGRNIFSNRDFIRESKPGVVSVRC